MEFLFYLNTHKPETEYQVWQEIESETHQHISRNEIHDLLRRFREKGMVEGFSLTLEGCRTVAERLISATGKVLVEGSSRIAEDAKPQGLFKMMDKWLKDNGLDRYTEQQRLKLLEYQLTDPNLDTETKRQLERMIWLLKSPSAIEHEPVFP